jgi:4-hydroxy-3-polyprenylbenzoate decarboxylase
MGATIAPPVPAFYANPQSVQDIVTNMVGRALDMFGLETGNWLRWGEEPHTPT